MNDILGWLLDTVRHVDPVLRILLAGVGMFCETSVLIGLIVPGDTIVLVAATATANVAEYIGLFLAVVIGSLAGETVGFALGRFFGHRIRPSRLGRRLGEHNWVRAENYLERRGGIAILISRFLPVLHALIPLTVGMSAIRYRKFLTWTAPACVVWAAGYVTVGWAAAGSYRRLSAQLHYAGYIFVAIIVLFLLAVLLIKKVIERREARHMVHPDASAGPAAASPASSDGFSDTPDSAPGANEARKP